MINSGDTTSLIKSVSFYFAITLEAFVFCFAGEFLSAKVCKRVLYVSLYSSLYFRYVLVSVSKATFIWLYKRGDAFRILNVEQDDFTA